MRRFAEIFSRARQQQRCALIPYITAGDPSLAASLEIALRLEDAGADILELGIPFSDPLADGPVIQLASERALRRGTRPADVIELAAKIRSRSKLGLLLFGYFNPILQYGLEKFAAAAASAGADGVLVTDLIPEEAAEYRSIVQAAGLDTVFLAAPTSPDERLRAIAQTSSGFIYAVSRTGVTGAREQVPAGARDLVTRLHAVTDLPIALGFGLSNAAQVKEVAGFADGAVVGTALVQTIASAGQETAAAAAAAGRFVASLRP
jgi:tryptophan synthase alpha chain